jgi:hypothetical protein
MMNSSAEPKPDKVVKPQQFILTGFTHTAGVRIYAFEAITDRVRTFYTVEVNLGLIAGFGIRIQDLPLLCREVLQQRMDDHESSALVFTEQQMRSHAEKLAIAREAAAQRKKPVRHLASPNRGAHWRTTFR